MTSSAEQSKGIIRKVIFPGGYKPAAPYSPGLQVGNTLYVSGLVGMDATGELVKGGIEPECKQVLANLDSLLSAAEVPRKNVVKVTILLADIKDYAIMNALYAEYFSDPFPARVAFQAVALPKNARIELEAIAIVGKITDEAH